MEQLGIIAFDAGNNQISNSYNKANIKCSYGNSIAGIIGQVMGAECRIENCNNIGNIELTEGTARSHRGNCRKWSQWKYRDYKFV